METYSNGWFNASRHLDILTMSLSATSDTSFLLRHEFAIRRLHSLLGIVPLGLYMAIHLTTNASLLNAPETFQRAVYMIHSPGKLLPLIEWGFIFTPLIFHAVIGGNGKFKPGQHDELHTFSDVYYTALRAYDIETNIPGNEVPGMLA